jgi:hypothetical protein
MLSFVKTSFSITVFLFFNVSVSAQSLARGKIKGASAESKTGIEAMSNFSQLPLLFPDGTETKQQSSYDPTGKNWDHNFPSAFVKYIDTIRLSDGSWKKEYVIFDDYGPGVLYRQQMNAWYDRSKIPNGWLAWGEADQPRANANILYYFDDEKEPRINMPLKDFFGTKRKPFTSPLAFVDSGYLFANSYYPFAFKKRLKVALVANSKSFEEMDTKWYQYTYLSFPPDYKLQTWKGVQELDDKVVKEWNKVGENPNTLSGTKTINTSYSIRDGESKNILELSGGGSITGLHLSIKPFTEDVFFNTQIKIYWDGNSQAAIDLPLAYLFGGGGKDFKATRQKVVEEPLKSLMFGYNKKAGNLYCYWPMPFWKSVKIVFENHSGTLIQNLNCSVNYKPSSVLKYDINKTGYFFAKRTVDSDPDMLGFRGVVFKETGHGHVVGISFFTDGYDMDGDEFTYIDDSRTPRIHGNGTEDDHDQGWAGRAYQKPLWGALINGYNGAYRIYLNDCYIFYKNILISYEYSLMKKNKFPNGGKTDVTIFYYKSLRGANLKLTDEIDVGNHFSESQHNYHVDKLTWKGILKDDYDGYERNLDYGSLTDDGKAFSGSSRFIVSIDSANKGVRLMKRINRTENGYQSADVFVDGKKVNRPWLIVTPSKGIGNDKIDGWYDSEFEIPRSITKNKKRVQIEIKYSDAEKKEVNEFYYWIYSYK